MYRLLCAWCVVAALAVNIEVQELQDTDAQSLIQTRESASASAKVQVQMSATATARLSESETEEFKAKFRSIVRAIKTQSIRPNVMIAERMASKILENGQQEDKGGLDLIFSKMDQLSGEIQVEQEEALAALTMKQEKAQSEIDAETATIDYAMQLRQENTDANKASHMKILEARKNLFASRGRESGPRGIQESLVKLRSDRLEASQIIVGEIDDRNKAIDIMIKALFLVCYRFSSFKDTSLCLSIKTQPDVDEPASYETKDLTEAEEETKLTHKADTPFALAWAEQKEKDMGLENAPCPETPETCPVLDDMRGDIQIQNNKKFDETDALTFYDELDADTSDHCAGSCNDSANCRAFLFVKDGLKCKLTDVVPEATTDDANYVTGIRPEVDSGGEEEALGEDNSSQEGSLEDDLGDFELLEVNEELDSQALTNEEQQALVQLQKLQQLAQNDLPAKYSNPIEALAITAGETEGKKKKKTVVTAIVEILGETKLEQAVAKSTHQDKLDEWYDQSWVQKNAINDETTEQSHQWYRWQEERSNIEQKIVASEAQRQAQLAAEESRVMIQDRIKEDERVYGIEEALRIEDLENLVKLNSLLRALYDATKPTGCPISDVTGEICSSREAGWCVFSARIPSKAQRCSCNAGFYGDACQFQMCPGLGDVLYMHDAEGVCSERGGGMAGGKGCDNTVGQCHCAPEYYSGSRNKCEYKHAPPSKYDTTDGYLMKDGTVDEKCSNRGTVDKIRGICACNEAFWGVAPTRSQQYGACETRKCPNSNGVLYAYTSGNACNGHGNCVPESGECICAEPYFGNACENTKCPNDCSDHGDCNIATGQCSCHQSPIEYTGPSCEFKKCAGGCNEPSGECNRNDAECICKMGYTGPNCQLSTRCPAGSLNTAEMNWWTVWDKPGWVSCPEGQLLYALKRGSCDALSCIESGSCAAACEGETDVYSIRHCYHDLGWYNSMDHPGWSKCLPDYYVAGLYRSCESLYCLNMAKCCSLEDARWAICGQSTWSSSFGNTGWSGLGQGPGEHAFITGIKRGRAHTISAIDEASYCGFVRGY